MGLSMVGVVRTRHLVTHPHGIVHEFGMRCYVRCVWRTVTGRRPVTFLECVAIEPARARKCELLEPSDG